MQAFYFTSGRGQPACNEAISALSVRSPETSVDLTANGANIHLGSHVTYMTSETTRR
jgi:hypothetical protein